MGIVMVAMLAFGGTFAYFTATTNNSTATAKLGTVRISNTSENKAISLTKNLLPGDVVLSKTDYKLENKSDVATYVFIKFTAEVTGTTATVATLLDIAEPTGWTKLADVDGVYYRADEGAIAEGAVPFEVKVKADLQDRWEDVTGAETASKKGYMGATINVTLVASAIQQKGYEENVKGAYEAIAGQTL